LFRKEIKAAITLAILSPIIAELLSGSSPPAEFFNPIGFLSLVGFYGCGAILIREAKARWNKNTASLLLLGAAYGVWEEGISVKSFFDPNWVDLGILGSYGRWLGVNWIWAYSLTIYHAVFSITIPVLLTEQIIFPEISEEKWLGRKGLSIALFSFLFVSWLLNTFLTTYQPSIYHYLLCIAIILILIYFAKKFNIEFKDEKNPPSHKKLWLFGFTWVITFYLISWVSPYILRSPILTALILTIQLYLCYRYLAGIDWKASNRRDLLALIIGLLSFWIILAPLQELDNPNRPDNTAGMSLVGLGILILLLWLWRKAGSN